MDSVKVGQGDWRQRHPVRRMLESGDAVLLGYVEKVGNTGRGAYWRALNVNGVAFSGETFKQRQQAAQRVAEAAEPGRITYSENHHLRPRGMSK